jgi:hypothetical protein
VQGHEGVVLRDLGTPDGTLVNGEPVAVTVLNDGDLLSVGPFRFRLGFTAAVPALRPLLFEGDALDKEREALGVQAAAVAAQQAALTETESQLENRRLGLERQEEQLAHHLNERRQRLLELQNMVKASRDELQKEQDAFEEERRRTETELEKQRQETAAGRRLLDQQRSRSTTFRNRLKRHYDRQLVAERASLRRREATLAAETQTLAREKERLEKDRAVLHQTRLELNGDRELGRRALQDGWSQLHQERKNWQLRQAAEQEELDRRTQVFRQRDETLTARETEIAEQLQSWADLRAGLQREAKGLDQRILNLRCKASNLEQQLARLEQQETGLGEKTPGHASVPPTAQPVQFPVAQPAGPLDSLGLPLPDTVVVAALTADLVDQRRQLVEQCERFVALQEQWRQDHGAALGEFESLQEQLRQRQQVIEIREQTLDAAEIALQQRQAETDQSRLRLEGWMSQFTVRESALEAEHRILLGNVHCREELLERQQQFLLLLRERWSERRRGEIKQRRTDLELTQTLRQRYAGLREECFRRRMALDQEHRSAAQNALALEQFRLELLSQSSDSAAAEKRLDKLRQRCEETMAAAEWNLADERQALEAEAARLAELAGKLQQETVELTRREEELSQRQVSWDTQQAESELERRRSEQQLANLRAKRECSEQQVMQLGEELERVARLLIDGDEPPALALLQAA